MSRSVGKVFNKTVLLVEDDPDLRDNMTEFLKSEGYDVQVASNGKQALDLLLSAEQPPSVILLDLMMPVMDGFAFRKEQRSHPALSDIPVVLMTADAQIEVSQARIQAQAMIRKPVDIDDLSRILSRFQGH